MALGSKKSPTEMSTRDIFWGAKAAGELGWQTYHIHVPIASKPWIPEDLSRPVQGLRCITFTFVSKQRVQQFYRIMCVQVVQQIYPCLDL